MRAKGRGKSTPPASSPAVRRRMLATGQRDTPAELAVRRSLYRAGLRYRVHYAVHERPRRVGDIVFPRERVVVFVDGCFWHACPLHGSWPKTNARFWREKLEANRARDRETTQLLERQGWIVLRFWEHDDPIEAARQVRRVVIERRRKTHTHPVQRKTESSQGRELGKK